MFQKVRRPLVTRIQVGAEDARPAESQDVDRLLEGAVVDLVHADPPYNVRVEPRSNNAIAAGLSSFGGATHHQQFDAKRHPTKSKSTGRRMRPRDRPLENDFLGEKQFEQLLQRWFDRRLLNFRGRQ